jgi:hypothetical protein
VHADTYCSLEEWLASQPQLTQKEEGALAVVRENGLALAQFDADIRGCR